MKVRAKLNNLRISARKVRMAVDLIRGMDVVDAIIQLNNNPKRASVAMSKLLKSAIANAENNSGLDKNNLYVYDVQVGEGPTLKRWMPRAQGRATSILKRTSDVNLELEEKIEGKNRMSPEKLKKIKEEKVQEAKAEASVKKEITEGKQITTKEVDGETEKNKKILSNQKRSYFEPESERKQSREGGWAKKIFRRKSN